MNWMTMRVVNVGQAFPGRNCSFIYNCRGRHQWSWGRREELKWNYPAYYYNGKRLCLTSGFKDHVTLELFYGAHLEDAQERIVGVGKSTRHIKLKSLKEIDTNYFVDLLQQSIELSQAGTST